MSRIGYGRVSTRDQNPDSQRDALTAAGCDRIFIDKASGKIDRRPELDKALDYVRPGDVFVITRLSRGRASRGDAQYQWSCGEQHQHCGDGRSLDVTSPQVCA